MSTFDPFSWWRSTQEFGRKFLNAGEDSLGKAFILAADSGDLENEYGQRPLHRAARRGHVAAVRMLLEHGADPNAKDNVGGYTALQYSSHYDHPEIVRLLVSYGADIYYCNEITRPVTYYAKKRPFIQEAISNGLNDLYIHRHICASFFNTYCTMLDLHTCMVIAEFLPRHQFPTEKRTQFLGNISPLNGADAEHGGDHDHVHTLTTFWNDNRRHNKSLAYENATVDLIDNYQQGALSDDELEDEKEISTRDSKSLNAPSPSPTSLSSSSSTSPPTFAESSSQVTRQSRKSKQRQKRCMYHQNFFFYDDFDDSQDFMTESDEENDTKVDRVASGDQNKSWNVMKWTWTDILWMIYEQYQYECMHLNQNNSTKHNRSFMQRWKQRGAFVSLLVIEWIRTLFIAMLYDESCMENNYKQMFLNFKKLQWIRRKQTQWKKKNNHGKTKYFGEQWLWWFKIFMSFAWVVFALVAIVWKTF
ncbi:Ankyrin [Reticulomyxa filosa]|uniref:Ankyrin n=1 Tax=Reticulomyxa filosa TaxID=46433 RepID=X6N8J6_RETFI|nr:Ankyrin [Reticulomyxa filosa]|eukprot:ETO22069.1 Ankyrin [Reticulomyxa filosa]